MKKKPIPIIDMTRLFRKEILLYSLFDLHFKTPVRLMFGVYFILLLLIWALPIFILFWPPNVYVAAIALVIPYGLAQLMSKPIWGGKSFLKWLRCQIRYIRSPKAYYDTKPRGALRSYTIDHTYIVSRARDFRKLFLLRKEEYGKEQ